MIFKSVEIDEHNSVRSVEVTEDRVEDDLLLKVTYFVGGIDVAMFRYEDVRTAMNGIRQFYAESGWKW